MSNINLPFKMVNPDLRKYGPALRGKICILEGLIAAGKSTASSELEKFVTRLGIPCKFFPEPLMPEMLELFLSDQKKYAFAFQLTMLVKRQAIYREADEWAKKGYFCIIDRSIHGDYCFALMHKQRGNISSGESTVSKEKTQSNCCDLKNNAKCDGVALFCPYCGIKKEENKPKKNESPTEWDSYLAVLNAEKFDHPDYVIYLEVSPETAIKRSIERDRRGEDTYDKAYFTDLCNVYASVIPASPAKQIMILDWNEKRQRGLIARILAEHIYNSYQSL